MRGQFPVGFRNIEAMYDHETFKCFKTTVRVLVFFVDFPMFSYKGSSGIFVAISDTTRILLVFKQDKFTELLSHFVFSSRFGYCFAKMI